MSRFKTAFLEATVPLHFCIQEVVIFDLAGVIAEDSFWSWAEERIPDVGAHRSELEQLSAKLDRGDLVFTKLATRLAELAHIPTSHVQPEITARTVINTELLAIIAQLKNRYTISLLSNGSGTHVRKILAQNNLYQYFDDVQISSECRIIKPHPEAFIRVLRRLRTTAAETIFIDDRAVNVEAARGLGIRAFLFTTNQQLLADLAEIPGFL